MPGCWALGNGEYPWGGGGGRLLLVSGPWKVAVTLREVELVPRAFGSGSGWVYAFLGGGGEGSGWHSVAIPSAVVTPEVTRAIAGACS